MTSRRDYFILGGIITILFLMFASLLLIARNYYLLPEELEKPNFMTELIFDMKFTGILFYFIYAIAVVASFTCSYRLCQLVDWFLDKFCLPAIDECSDFEVVEAKKQLIISDV